MPSRACTVGSFNKKKILLKKKKGFAKKSFRPSTDFLLAFFESIFNFSFFTHFFRRKNDGTKK